MFPLSVPLPDNPGVWKRVAKALRTPSHYAFEIKCKQCGESLASCWREDFFRVFSGGKSLNTKSSDLDLFECLKCGEVYRAEIVLTRVGSNLA